MERFINIFIFGESTISKENFVKLLQDILNSSFEMTKKFLMSFDKVIKVSNIERFAKFNIEIVNHIFQVYEKNRDRLGQIQQFEDKLNDLIAIFSANLNNPNPLVAFNIHNLILINYLVNPAPVDGYFAEFVSFNNNKGSEDGLLFRTLQSYSKKLKDPKSFSAFKLEHEKLQKLIQDFVAKILRSDKYRMFAPTMANALIFHC